MAPPRKHLNRRWLGMLAQGSLILMSAVAFFEMRIHPNYSNFGEEFEKVIRNLKYPEYPKLTIRSDYLGIPSIDFAFRVIATVFMPGATPFRLEFGVLQSYFLISLVPITSIYTIEAVRYGSAYSWIKYTSLLGLMCQTIGGAIILPLWFLMFLRHSARFENYSPRSVRVPISYARALIPAIVLGFLIPTMLLYMPSNNDPDLRTKQALIAFWQLSPVYVNIILEALAKLFDITTTTTSTSLTSPTATDDDDDDALYVTSLYALCLCTSLVAHAGLLTSWSRSRWSPADVFLGPKFARGPPSEVLHWFFQLNHCIVFAAALITAHVVSRDLHLLSSQTRAFAFSSSSYPSPSSLSLALALVLVLVASCVVGPAATLSILWWRREIGMRTVTSDEDAAERIPLQEQRPLLSERRRVS